MDGNVAVIRLDETKDFPILFLIKTQSDLASSVDMDHDYILTGCDNAVVGVWEAATGTNLHMMEGHLQGVTAVRIGVNSKLVASGSYDCRVRVWNVEHGICIAVLQVSKFVTGCLL